jgi:hypothetical protein
MSNTAYDSLIHEVCVRLGFCGCIKDGKPLHVDHFIPSEGPVSAEKFAEWVFLAEDMNPSSKPKRWEQVKATIEEAFVRHMDANVVDASRLRWSFADEVRAGPDRRREPLLLKHEVWRPLKNGEAMRYNCVQNVRTGEVCVVTADFVRPNNEEAGQQVCYFIEQVLAVDPTAPDDARSWFRSLDDAIAAHDQDFSN